MNFKTLAEVFGLNIDENSKLFEKRHASLNYIFENEEEQINAVYEKYCTEYFQKINKLLTKE